MNRFILIVAFCFSFHTLYCQSGISASIAPSKLLKHRSSLLFDVPNSTQEFRIAYTHQTSGEKEWEQYWGKPKIALNAGYVNFGDSEVLGNAIFFLPELHFVLKDWNKLKLNLQFGSGYAYLNKPFNSISNPKNNAIGSNNNNVSSLKFGVEYQMSKRILASLSTGIVHFSNGLSSSPNAGLNIYGLTLSANYLFNIEEEETAAVSAFTTDTDNLPQTQSSKWKIDLQYNFGITEYSVPGGPKYVVDALSLSVGYRYAKYLTVYLGAEYEFNDAKYTFYKSNFFSEEEALNAARSSVIYVENELRFGWVFHRFRLGYYLAWPQKNEKSYYIKSLVGLYVPLIHPDFEPYIGVLLKTHGAVADYLAPTVGLTIKI